jgi:hypothetical protein
MQPEPVGSPMVSGDTDPRVKAPPSPLLEQSRSRPGWMPGRVPILTLILVCLWLALLADPLVGPVILSMAWAFGLTLGVILAAMLLGGLGFGLFAAGDRIRAWLFRAGRWPDE